MLCLMVNKGFMLFLQAVKHKTSRHYGHAHSAGVPLTKAVPRGPAVVQEQPLDALPGSQICMVCI